MARTIIDWLLAVLLGLAIVGVIVLLFWPSYFSSLIGAPAPPATIAASETMQASVTPTPDAKLQEALARITQEALDTIVARAPDLPTATPVPPVDRAKQAASQQELAAAQTQAERVPSVSSDGIDVGNGVLVAGPPTSVVPTKFGNGEASSATCSVPGACWILKDPGVINAENTADCGGNRSCVPVNPDTQFSLTSPTETALCSRGGYLQFSTATATVVVGDNSFTLPRLEDHGWVALLRCSSESNQFVNFSAYDPGATLVSRYPVPVDAGAFRSEVQQIEEVVNTHTSENCGGGSDGCRSVGLFLLDVNDGTYTVLSHTIDSGWTLVATNVQ